MPVELPRDPIHTARLVLRPRRAGEAAVYRRLWEERDPRVPEHRRPDAAGRPTASDIAARIDAEEPGLFAVVRRDTGAVIGYCGLVADPEHADEPELAFELLAAEHGQGFATEAAAAVVHRAREAGIPRLRAGVWDWNTASRRVLEKLGFREVGADGPTSEHGRTLLTLLDL